MAKLLYPLSREELNNIQKDNRISVDIDIRLEDLIDFDLEALNDYADARIIGFGFGSLMDIAYRVVGFIPEQDKGTCCTGSILLNVTADITEILEEDDYGEI